MWCAPIQPHVDWNFVMLYFCFQFIQKDLTELYNKDPDLLFQKAFALVKYNPKKMKKWVGIIDLCSWQGSFIIITDQLNM